MYGNTSVAGGVLAASVITAGSDWSLTGFGVLGVSIIAAGVMTARRLGRLRR
jgi:type IV secretory pathway TrbD component